jgi:S-DNA-T family DNA segregation ATPase FtsK/SpoIIIE
MNEYNFSDNGVDYDPDRINQYTPPRRRPDDDNAQQATPRKRKKKNADKAQSRKSLSENGFIKFLCNKRFHAVFGVALMFLAGYITVAAITFLRSGSEDQSLIENMSVGQIVDAGKSVNNAAGPVGAQIAQSLLVQGLGLGSLALIVYLVLLGISLMGFRKTGFWSLTFKTLLVAITISIVLGFGCLWFGSDVDLGGYHGHYINALLVGYLDWIGAALISLLLLIAVFYVYINDILRIYNSYKAMRQARRDQADQWRLEEEENQKRVQNAMDEVDKGDESTTSNSTTAAHSEIAIGFDEFTDDGEPENTDTFEVNREGGTELMNSDNNDHRDESDEGYVADENDNQTSTAVSQKNMPQLDVVSNTIEAASGENTSTYDPTAELPNFKLPGLDLLRDVPIKSNSVDLEEQEENKERITKTLNDYGIEISHIHATVGPTVTLYEIIPAEGVRIAKIKRLEDDIAMSLSALGIRIIAPIPGKGTIGIEVPNKEPQTVSIRSILGSKKFMECKAQLPMAMGATISNDVYIADLCKMPHLLVAGATGMGKSVGLNTIIASLLYKKHPAELKFVLIDPKMVEFSLYSVLERHYLAKLPDEDDAVVTSMDKVLATLNSLCIEMDQRYLLLRDANVRSITEYNERFIGKHLNPEKGHRYLPYIVMIVDEFADLIMTAGKEVEKPIARIAQKARAVGMHMIIATQRPSTNVITGIIKANFPGRIAFRVSQMVDSKTILDRTGANQLIGRGDMLFSHNGSLDRVQCAFIDTPEVQAICNHIDQQVGYEHAYYLPEPVLENDGAGSGNLSDRDTLFEEAAEIVVKTGVASTSSLQRRYSIGYNRAGKIMDQLEAAGIVGPAQGGKPRQVLIDQMQLGSIIRTLDND